MDTEKIKACMVSLTDGPNAHEDLKRIIPFCADPPLTLSQVFMLASGQREAHETVEAIGRLRPDLVIISLSAKYLKQAELFVNSLQRQSLKAEILAFFEDPTSGTTIDLLKLGIADVIYPPFAEENVVPRIWRILNSRKGPDERLLGSLKENLGLRRLIGGNTAFLSEVNKIPLIARCDANVLIAGETGTGKEIYARSIHYLSRRASKPFIAVSCGAIPADLFENELFGHERGAFTGAITAQAGLIQEAEGGSLFLDDIDCIPTSAQMKMLRFLQEKEFRPLGSARAQHSDTRIIASTNSDLSKAVSQNVFRRDLYYRLSVISIILPTLRSRLDDIPLLARHFIEKYRDEFESTTKDLSTGAIRKLMSYEWPGNVRELENVIERSVAFSHSPLIDTEDIYLPEDRSCLPEGSFKEAKLQAVAQFENRYIRSLLATHHGNISKSAKTARKNRRAFWELIRKHKIDPREYKSAAFC
jgi:two-component system response regulator GlrR